MPQPLIRVLLVEDNATDALVAQDELQHAVGVRFEVVHCVRLESALEHLAKAHFDVVLLDLTLPDSDGLETFTQLHVQQPEVPVVLLSHRADASY